MSIPRLYGELVASLVLPGLEVATTGGDGWREATRVGPNQWALAVGTAPVRRALLADAATVAPPSSAVAARSADEGAALLKVELDLCGAWVTASTSGGLRPVVVRKAGWVDLRWHGPGAPRDDRIGLGPGDSLVVPAGPTPEDRLLDGLLSVAGANASAIAAASGLPRVAVLFVPEASGEEAITRVEAATGIPREELQLPGYPLGDEQRDLWRQPPAPPREARLRLAPHAADIAVVRRLLRRLLASWRLESLVDEGDVELLATETATNAMRHAGTDATVVVRYLGDRVRVEVGDGSTEVPQLRRAAADELGGRGLSLVDALSARWGVVRTVGGKRVWFEVMAKPTPPR